jgi:hypothetical protein
VVIIGIIIAAFVAYSAYRQKQGKSVAGQQMRGTKKIQ